MASFHLQFSVPFTHIRFQVFMNDVEVLREESKNGIFVPAILLSKSDEPAAPASAGKKSAVVAVGRRRCYFC